MIPIGLQLYTIGKETKRDFLGTIRRVGAIGYDGVEFAGYFDTSAEVLKRTLEESGLRAAGTHLGVPVLRDPTWPRRSITAWPSTALPSSAPPFA